MPVYQWRTGQSWPLISAGLANKFHIPLQPRHTQQARGARGGVPQLVLSIAALFRLPINVVRSTRRQAATTEETPWALTRGPPSLATSAIHGVGNSKSATTRQILATSSLSPRLL
uniref:Uncharacterized protein n=1 Tax=Oryza sativa subsp. japonica TaxID=39947 RepID=Q6ER48_ORYSJ|nr:hypothetical protein [Oryza sativa Japonica Group]